MNGLNIVFAGSPEFAIPYLEALLASPHAIVGVITKPDKQAGRGKKLQPTAVKKVAIAHQLPVFEANHLNDPNLYHRIAALKADLAVVVAYGALIPQSWLDMPCFGWINVHASLLPKWRGAAPIQHALLAGDSETGVSIMQLEAGLDTGSVWEQASIPILASDTTSTLTTKLSRLGIDPLLRTLTQLQTRVPTPQPAIGFSLAPKLNVKTAARLKWCHEAHRLERIVRAFPGSAFFLHPSGLSIKVKVACVNTNSLHDVSGALGQILSRDKRGVVVQTGADTLRLQTIQLPNRTPYTFDADLNSHAHLFKPGICLNMETDGHRQ